MNMQKPLKCAAAVVTAVLVFTGASGVAAAETTQNSADNEAVVQAVSETAENQSAKTEWWKAEITDYDSSLSLISYEITPDTTSDQTEEDVTATDKDKEKTTEKTASTESIEIEDVPAVDPTTGNVVGTGVPTPVASQTTDGVVTNVPQSGYVPEIDAQSGEFAFVTYGWGHGVGMSQNGANYYASYSGWTYQDILFHYYPGTYLMNTGTADSEQLTVNGVSGDTLSMVAGIVYREVGSSMAYEAIKAQAVAVYSYIKYYGDNARDLRCKSDPPQNVIDACSEVLGQALYYDGSYALTMFSASSGGVTANCYDVFTSDLPYLRSVSSDYDAACDPHYGTVTYISSSSIKSTIESKYGITLSDDPSNWFYLITGDSGYISSVVIDGQITVRGYDLKLALDLKSSKFDLYYTP